MALAAALLGLLGRDIIQDTWLALLAGRDIAEHGLPHREPLTVLAHGRRWIDQQWLAQLAMYELDRAGGVVLVGFVNAVLVMAGLLGAILAARRLGASARSIVRVLPLVVWTIALTASVRTQPWAYPLFSALLWLLASDTRRPSGRIWWCLPLLALWGNVHGSATLGAGLVGLRGLTILWERRARLRRVPRSWARPVGLLAGAPLCLLASPYGLTIVHYYRTTLFNRSFRTLVPEWGPVTGSPVVASLFFLTAAVVIWSFGRHRSQTTLWERAAILVLGVAAIVAVRNVVWFNLARATPTSDAAVRARKTWRCAVTWRSWARWPWPFPPPPRQSLSRELLLPQRGRARFELLSAAELAAVAGFKAQVGPDWERIASGYRLLVLQRSSTATSQLEHAPGARVLFDRDGMVVIRR